MFKRSTNGGNNYTRDLNDTESDIIGNTEPNSINQSDSAPILNRSIDLSNSVHHDLRSTDDFETTSIKRSLRTIPGVFCPVALSMCSVAVFMRIGFIVGNAGVYESLAMYLLAFGILLTTVLSICAISTNGAIKGGGAYYMISRALGPEFGGSVGTLFFFANALCSAYNAAGLVESLLSNFGASKMEHGLPEDAKYKFLYGTCFNVISLIICLLGANLFSYAVAFIYLVVVGVYFTVIISLFAKAPILFSNLPGSADKNITSMFTRVSSETIRQNLYANYSVDYTTKEMTDFPYVFGVLFSSVTGILAGANMSGELKKPARSIPLGTLSAVAFVFFVYFTETMLVAAACEHTLLVNHYQVLQAINLWGPFIPIGIVAATFSGELATMIGSSRVLKALADDDLFGPILRFVKFGQTKSGNPYAAVLVTFAIAEVTLLVGSLNKIAPLVTIFYLLAYFGVNLSCLALDLASAPNFRPTFKYFTWHTSLIGMVGAISMTFIVSVKYASVAIAMLIGLIAVLYFRDFSPEWGSISQALIFHQVRKYLLLLDTRKDHVKFWRPQILLLVTNPRSCVPLIDFVNDIKKGGLYVIGNVRVGELDKYEDDPCNKEIPHWVTLVDNLKIKAFIELTLSTSVKEGIYHLIRISGLGGMKPNTVVIGFYDQIVPEDLLKDRQFPKRRKLLNYGLNSTNSTSFQAVFNSFGFEELRKDGEQKKFNLDDYVEVIRNTLKLRKNLCIARKFNLLKKEVLLAKGRSAFYIDVWPINFLLPESCAHYDSTCLFMLQLACILNMVNVWRRAVLRVFLCTDSIDAVENARRKTRLDSLLHQLRIHALTSVIQLDTVKNLLNRQAVSEADLLRATQNGTSLELMSVSDTYLKAVNQLLRQHSEQSSLCFVYLPSPPTASALNIGGGASNASAENTNSSLLEDTTLFHESNQRYMRILELISDNLPPTLFVNGVSCVTSTHL